MLNFCCCCCYKKLRILPLAWFNSCTISHQFEFLWDDFGHQWKLKFLWVLYMLLCRLLWLLFLLFFVFYYCCNNNKCVYYYYCYYYCFVVLLFWVYPCTIINVFLLFCCLFVLFCMNYCFTQLLYPLVCVCTRVSSDLLGSKNVVLAKQFSMHIY